jgi:hypothetical protein
MNLMRRMFFFSPEVSDWKSEYDLEKQKRSNAARTGEPSAQEIHERTLMREAVRELKQKTHQPHLVFIGDSMMRQQYDNLASWLIHDEARPEEPETAPDKESNYTGFWSEKYAYQKAQLEGDGVSEVCHCGRQGEDNSVEDRFITLPGNGSSLSYFGWFGNASFNGYFTASDARPTQASCPVGKCTSPFHWTIKQPDWRHAAGIVELLDSVIVHLQPKPTHVVVNSGKWGHLNGKGLHNLFSAGAKIQKRDGIKFMWKTVSHSKEDTQRCHQRSVKMEKALAYVYGWEVFDTYMPTHRYVLRNQYYLDLHHFAESVVTYLNRIYLGILSTSLQ